MRHGRSRGPETSFSTRAIVREHLVRREMSDACVDRREPVDVEHEEGELLSPCACSRDLEVEQRMERRAVVEIRERVALRDGIRLAQLERRLQGGTADAEDVFERGDVDLAEPSVRRRA